MRGLGLHLKYFRLLLTMMAAVSLLFSACFNNVQNSSTSDRDKVKLPIGTSGGTPDGEDDPWFVQWKVKAPPPQGECVRPYGIEGAVQNAKDGDAVCVENQSRQAAGVRYIVENNGSFFRPEDPNQCLAGFPGDVLKFSVCRDGVTVGQPIRKIVRFYSVGAVTKRVVASADGHVLIARDNGIFYCVAAEALSDLDSCIHFGFENGFSSEVIEKFSVSGSRMAWVNGANYKTVEYLELMGDSDPVHRLYESPSKVISLLLDNRGAIWINLGNVVRRVQFDAAGKAVVSEYRFDEFVSSDQSVFAETDDRVWLTEVASVYSFQKHSSDPIVGKIEIAQVAPTAMLTAADGTLWIGTRDSGLFRRQRGGAVTHYNMANSGLPSNQIVSISEAQDGRSLLIVCDSTSWNAHVLVEASTPLEAPVVFNTLFSGAYGLDCTGCNKVVIDKAFKASDQSIWINGFLDQRLGLGNHLGLGFARLTADPTMSPPFRSKVYYNPGIPDGEWWSAFPVTEFLQVDASVWSVTAGWGIWVWRPSSGGDGELSRANGIRNRLFGSVRYLLQDSDESVWLAGGMAVNVSRGGQMMSSAVFDKTDETVGKIAKAPDGSMWVAGSFGQVIQLRIDGQGNPERGGCNLYFPNSFTEMIITPSDAGYSVWLGSEYHQASAALYKVSVDANGTCERSSYSRPSLEFEGIDESGVNSVILLVDAGDGSIWVGTAAGLARFKDGAFIEYPGIPFDRIAGLVKKKPDDSVWVATAFSGLFVIRKDGSVQRQPGLDGQGISSLYEAGDGSLWVGGNKGYVGHLELNEDGSVKRFRSFQMEATVPLDFTPGVFRDMVMAFLDTTEGVILMRNSGGDLGLFDEKAPDHISILRAGDTGVTLLSFLRAQNGAIWLGADMGAWVMPLEELKQMHW